jgi:hypothetical protein
VRSASVELYHCRDGAYREKPHRWSSESRFDSGLADADIARRPADVPGFKSKKPGPISGRALLSRANSMSFDQAFSAPILLTDGRKLRTIRDAATFVTRLPKAEQDAAPWQTTTQP